MIKIFSKGGTPGLLEKLARRIEPTPEELAAVREKNEPLPKHSRLARLFPSAYNLRGFLDMKQPGDKLARPTNHRLTYHDGREMVIYTDGSFRRAVRKPQGKANAKRHRRARQAARRITCTGNSTR